MIRSCLLVVGLMLSGVSFADDNQALEYYQQGYRAESRGSTQEAISLYRKALAERSYDGRITIPGKVHYEWYETPRGMARRKIESGGSSEPYYPEQRMNALLAKVERERRELQNDEQRRQKFMNPPQLLVTAELLDAGNDKAIDGGESGKLLVTVQNNGQSRADQVVLKLDSNSYALQHDSSVNIGSIEPGKSLVRAIPYQAGKTLRDGPLKLKISAREKDGFDSRDLSLETLARAFQPAKLQIARQEIRRGEGSLLLVSYDIVNQGKGVARDVTVAMTTDDRVILRNESDLKKRIGTLAPNEMRTVEVGLYTSLRSGDGLKLALQVTEADNAGGLSQRLALNVPDASSGGMGMGSVAYTPVAAPVAIDNVGLNIPAGAIREEMAVGVIIGNSNYQNLDPVRYASQDARTVSDYVVKAMGYSQDNVRLERDLSSREFRRLFGTRERGFKDGVLYRRVELNARRRENPPVFVYYSGHGAPSLEEDGKAYLVPVDTTLRDLTYDGYALDDFYASIAALPSNNVTVVIDSCFSGSTNDGLLQKDISPALLKTADTITPVDMGNASVFTSTSPSQVSYWYNEARHSLFTYYFLKGLRGSADGDSDQRITSGELHEYLSWNVANYILEANKPSDQTPQLVGDSHRVMAVYAGAR